MTRALILLYLAVRLYWESWCMVCKQQTKILFSLAWPGLLCTGAYWLEIISVVLIILIDNHLHKEDLATQDYPKCHKPQSHKSAYALWYDANPKNDLNILTLVGTGNPIMVWNLAHPSLANPVKDYFHVFPQLLRIGQYLAKWVVRPQLKHPLVVATNLPDFLSWFSDDGEDELCNGGRTITIKRISFDPQSFFGCHDYH